MKKLLAIAIATIVTAPVLADTTLYGAIRASAITGEAGGTDLGGLVNNASRIGVKGSYGDPDGLTGFFNIQQGVNTDSQAQTSGFTNRFAMAGVKGGFGTVVVGRLSSPYKMAGLKLDPFYDTSAGTKNGGSNYGLSSLTNGWLNNVVGYISPKFGGAFTVNAVAMLGKDDNEALIPNENFFNPGITYSKNGITADIQHITEIKATRYALGYKTGAASAGVSYEDLDNDASAVYLAGTYKMGRSTLAASYGEIDKTGATSGFNTQGSGYSLGLFQKIAPKTTVTAIYSDVDADNDAGDRDLFSVGLIQKF